MADNTSDRIGIASVATTDGLSVPRYGLAYDLATGSWQNAAQFRQFVRDVLPVTQQKAQQQSKLLQEQMLRAQEFQRAQNYEQHGLFVTNSELGVDKSGVGNQIMTGFKALKGYSGNIASSLVGGVGDLLHGNSPFGDTPSYEEYTAKGGLLTEEEFNRFSDKTKLALLDKATLHHELKALAATPGVAQTLTGLGTAYRGLTAGAEMLNTKEIPVLGSWLQILGGDNVDNQRNPFSSKDWKQAWIEAEGDSLGNALLNTTLDPFATPETLDRWKRDNPWYQMSSFGTELAATWYIDPVVLGGKALGASARFTRGEFPINEASQAAIALRQATQREVITVRNPLAKGYAKVQAHRIENNWQQVEKAAQATTPAEFAQLPMFRQAFRAQDGGAAAYALHWAANNKAMVREALGPTVDPFDLTKRLTMGDPKAYAMLRKLQEVPPEELQRIAPGAGTLLDATSALRTKADVLQSEIDDLNKYVDSLAGAEPGTPMWEHRWEIHTDIAKRQEQLAQATDMLEKYDGYQNWLDLVTGPKGDPILSRVQGPSRKRWSEIRQRPGDGATETRGLFMDNQFGTAHAFHKITKPLFIKRANTVEIHNLDSGLMSINRQFDQFEHLFGYAPEGARDAYLNRYVRANSAFDRYKILHDLEETHLIGAVAAKFGIDPEMARTIIHKIDAERNASIQGILSGEGAVYRSAPSLKSRVLGGNDQSLSLVSRDTENGTVRLKLMNGRKVEEYEVPEAALERRAIPEDPTQTPNYYNPMDTRRLFHKLKHEPAMLSELNAGFLRRDAAAAAQAAEWVGTTFNELWKPIQLFRLGWPMRVLMDEGARATAVFGPMYWTTGAGGDAVRTVGRNIVPNVANYIAKKRRGPLGVEMGPGPVSRASMQTPDQFARDAAVRQAVQVPQEFWDNIVPERAVRIQQHVNTGPTPAHPMWSVRGERGKTTVYDPATGRPERGGYVVPVKTFEVGNGTPEQMVDWYKNHAELLSRRGMRVVVDADGKVTVGRLFRQGDFSRAHQFAQYASEVHPDTRIWDLRTGRWTSVEDAPMTPMTKAAFWHESDAMPDDIFDASESMVADGLHTAIPRDVAITNGRNTYRLRGADGRRRAVFDLDREVTPAQRAELAKDGITVEGATWAEVYDRLDPKGQADLTRYLADKRSVGALTHTSGDSQVYVWLDPDLQVRAWNGESSYRPLADRFAHPASVERPLRNQDIRARRTAKEQARQQAQAVSGDLRRQEVGFENPALDLSDFDFDINDPLSHLFDKMRTRREQGAGWKVLRTSDGKTVSVPNAFEGHSGEIFRGLTASNGVIDFVSEGHGGGSSAFRRKAAGYRVYSPPQFTEKALQKGTPENKRAVRYFQVYADTINDHLGNSPIVQRMIRGESDDKIINWLETSVEGQRVLRDVKPKGIPTGIWVDDHRFKLNYYVPNKELQRRLGNGRLQPADFRKKVADEDLPVIYGPDLEVLDRRRGAGRFLSDWADKIWTVLGNKPIDAFSRHPFAKAMYDRKMQNLIASTDSKWLTPEMIERYQKQAHQHAINETRRHLYNLTETTNFNDALRFVAPFWGAQYEAIQKWLRIISDRPETLGRFFGSQRAVYNNFVVTDPNNDNKVVKTGTRPGGLAGLGLYHPQDMVTLPLTNSLKKKFNLDGIGKVGIPLGSANTVLQGDLPLFPSLGPLVTVPADVLLRKVSDTYGTEHSDELLYRWFFPIGQPRSKDWAGRFFDQTLPGWANRLRQATSPEDTLARFNMETLVGREMVLRNRQLGKPDPTVEEITKTANHLWHVRIIAGLVLPVQTQFLPDHQYWIDAAHQYQKKYGNDWWDKYIEDYSEEAAIFATSSSNSVGVPPTVKGIEEYAANKKLIAKHPNWTQAIISPQAYTQQFSPDVYGQQFNILMPGTGTALRSASSLQERLFTDPNVQLGWREYRKLNATIEAELYARGLTNIQQRGAEDLAQMKRAGKMDIASKYPEWARAFEGSASTIHSDIEDLRQLAPNPIFDNRPDWQGVRQYLYLRDQVTGLLDAYGQQGGSRSLQAQENGALRDWFYNQVGQLVLDNPAFAEFYSRYLDNDTLETGSGF